MRNSPGEIYINCTQDRTRHADTSERTRTRRHIARDTPQGHTGLERTRRPATQETGARRQARAKRPRSPSPRAYARLARPPIASSALSALSSILIASRWPGSARACVQSRVARPTSARSALHRARRRRTRRRGRAGWHQPSRHQKRIGIGREGPRKNCSVLFPAAAAPHGRCAGHAQPLRALARVQGRWK